MKYYGARWASGCSPSDLFVTYFTSSVYVKKYIEDFGMPDIIEVRRVFTNHVDVQNWENKVIQRLKAVARDDYLNKNYGSKGWNPNDKDIRKKISIARTGVRMSEATKLKIAEKQKQKIHDASWNNKVSKALLGKKHSAERIKALKAGHAKLPRVTCPHCGTEGKGPNMSRYHFKNCVKLASAVVS